MDQNLGTPSPMTTSLNSPPPAAATPPSLVPETTRSQNASTSMTATRSRPVEPYGPVKIPTYNGKSGAHVQLRRPSPNYVLSASSLTTENGHSRSSMHRGKKAGRYQHNPVVAVFMGISVSMILWNHTSPAPLRAFLCSGLVMYALDLANLRDGAMVGVWFAFAFLAATNAWNLLMQTEDHEANGTLMLVVIFRMMVETLLFMCLGCWTTLQFEWLNKDTPLLAKMTEQILHTCLVPVFAAVVAYQVMSTAVENIGTDRVVTVAPHLFASLLAVAMLFLGCCESSYSKSGRTNGETEKKELCVPSSIGLIHSILLLLIPPMMHVLSFRKRIMSSYASFDELYDLALAWTVPYLLHFGIHLLHQQKDGRWRGPYTLPILFPPSGGTLRGTLIPILVSVAASFALQQNYLIPFCQSVSYQFNGHDMAHVWITSTYLSVATLGTLAAVWLNGKVSSVTNEPLFGEYHDDVVQLSLALSGLCVGKALGMPWNLTPLPILAFLGFTIWAATRMLRYLAIVLFVVHSAGMVIFSYRFAGIANTINYAWFSLNLTRFGMVIILASLFIALVMGIAVRSKGGYGAELMKRLDLAGVFLVVYTVLLTTLEITLLATEVPFRSLLGIEGHEEGADVEIMIYQPFFAFGTATALGFVALYLQHCKIIRPRTAVLTLSMVLAKVLTVLVDMVEVHRTKHHDGTKEANLMLIRFGIASLMIIVLMAPRAFLTPIHVKTSGSIRRKSQANGSGNAPASSATVIFVYAVVILPITLILSIPFVLAPFMGVLSGHWGGMYHQIPAASQIIGMVACLWGLSMLSMLNFYLPDAGAELWKKVCALTFLMGIGIAITGPTLPDWFIVIRRSHSATHVGTNPFAVLSSVGSQMVTGSRSRAGGWGLLSAALATLLALTGPLELAERRSPGGPRDRFLLLRTMIFSVMFGCGVSWFITLQTMGEQSFLSLFVTCVACMAMSFFGTVSSVLGYFLELENFEEVIQVVQLWALSFPLFAVTAGVSQLAKDSADAFGMGGWLSTYLSVCGLVLFGFGVVLRSRESKARVSRGLGNLAVLLSWCLVIVVLYGKFGVAGLDSNFDVTLVAGVPASVVGTCLAGLMLLALEGESHGRGSTRKIRSSDRSTMQDSYGLVLPSLNSTNRHALPLASVVAVFVLATTYALLLRGCGFFASNVSFSDMFSSFFGVGGPDSSHDDLADLAEKNMVHSQALAVSAKLAASSFWTAKTIMGPLIHLLGLLSVLPSLFFVINRAWTGNSASGSLLTLSTPLNIVPVVFCKGIPTLRALAVLGLLGGIVDLFVLRNSKRRSNMRI